MRSLIGLLGLGALVWTGCQPDKKDTPTPDSTQLLTGGSSRTWRLQTLSVRGSSQAIPPCRADDRWTFRSDGTGTFQNSTPCDPNDPNDPSPSVSIRWRFTNNNRYLAIEGTNYFATYEVIQLSDNILVWEYTGSDGLVQETWIP